MKYSTVCDRMAMALLKVLCGFEVLFYVYLLLRGNVASYTAAMQEQVHVQAIVDWHTLAHVPHDRLLFREIGKIRGTSDGAF
jgi:hypothetical protein